MPAFVFYLLSSILTVVDSSGANLDHQKAGALATAQLRQSILNLKS